MTIIKKGNTNRITEQLWQMILAASIFTFGLFYNCITYLEVKGLALCVSAIAITGLLVYRKVNIDIRMLLLFLVFYLIGFHNSRNWLEYDVAYTWMLTWPYIIGKIAVGNDRDTADNKFYFQYFVMAAGMTTIGLSEVIKGIITHQYHTELLFNFWTGEPYVRTTHEYNYVFMIAALLFSLKAYKHYKACIGIIILDCLIVCAMVRNEGRYSMLFVFIQLVIFGLLFVISKWNSNASIKYKKMIVRVLTIICVVGIASIILIRMNFLGLYDLYENSYLNGGGGILTNIRFRCIYECLKAIPTHMLGQYDYLAPEGSHNMWLEYGDKYGVFILSLLYIFKILTIKDAVQSSYKLKSEIKYLIAAAVLYIHIYYTLEPNGFAHREFIIFGLFLFGMIKGRLELEEVGDIKLGKIKEKVILNETVIE